MKATVYVRVGKADRGSVKGRLYVRAGSKPDYAPLENASGFVPTVAFAIQIDIPESLFRQAERVIAELDVSETTMKVAAEIQSPEAG